MLRFPFAWTSRKRKDPVRSTRARRDCRIKRRALFETLEGRALLATDLVSIGFPSSTPAGPSVQADISGDGRYVAFASAASDVIAGDTNNAYDVFVRDTQTGVTTRVSVDSAGLEADGGSFEPSISADGRYVAFQSAASNLVSGDTNHAYDIFVRDLQLGTTTRVSLDSADLQANGDSLQPSMSGDGQRVAFQSYASNLTTGDANAVADVFVRDLQTGVTTRVSVDSGGAEGNNSSAQPAISADGQHVAFQSVASNLTADDANGVADVFLRDLQTDTTTLVSLDSAGLQGNNPSSDPSVSVDGRFVAFASYASNLEAGDTNSTVDVFWRDLQTGTTSLVSVDSAGVHGNGSSLDPSISDDGGLVAFRSSATNLVAGDTNGAVDVFVRDLQTPATSRISVDSAGGQANGGSLPPAISGDGRYVAFASSASNLAVDDSNASTDVFVFDRHTAATVLASPAFTASIRPSNDDVYGSAISADGRYVAFTSPASNLVPGDGNGATDVFVRDLLLGTTTLVSMDTAGIQANTGASYPAISADGRYVAFESSATNLVSGDTNGRTDIFVRDLLLGTTTRVSVDSGGLQGNNNSDYVSISADGRYVAFRSLASNLVTGDTNGRQDIFVHDRQLGTTTRVSVDTAGIQANNASYFPVISADGRSVAFYSDATNLVVGDTNNVADTFVRDLLLGTTTRVSVDAAGEQANGQSYFPSLSAEGRYLAFTSSASNLVPGDTDGATDVFVRDLRTGTTTLLNVGIEASISGDGRYVAFSSDDTNVVPGDTNGVRDVFVFDRQLGVTARVSLDSAGMEGNGGSTEPSISADGRFVIFSSDASNLVEGDVNGVADLFRVSNPLFNTPPVATNGAAGTDEDIDLTVDFRPLVSDEQSADADLTYNILSVTHGTLAPTATVGLYTFTPEANYSGAAVVTFNVTDPAGETSSPDNTFTIDVTAVNDPGQVSITGVVQEDQTLTANVSDVEGISGTIAYQWQRNGDDIIGAVSSTYMLGDADVGSTIRVLASYVDDQGAAESATSNETSPVANINDAPVLDASLSPVLATIAEDDANPAGTRVSDLLSGAVTDLDAAALQGIAVTAASNYWGTWQYSLDDGASWTGMGEPSSTATLLLPDSALVRFIPNINFNGTVKLWYRAWDQTKGTAGGTLSSTGNTGGTKSLSTTWEEAALVVTPANDAPVLDNSGSPTLTTIWEDATNPYGTPVKDFASSAITDVDAGALKGIAVIAAASTNGAWQFTLDGTTWQTMGTPLDSAAVLLPADATTRVRFIPAANWNGTVSLSYRAWDRTQGTAGGTLDTAGNTGGAQSMSAASETASLTVIAVDDKPVLKLSGTIGYVHDAAAIVVAPNASVSDIDSPDFLDGQLRVRITDGVSATNRLAIGAGFTVDANNNVLQGSTIIGKRTANGFGTDELIIQFNANATPPIAQQLVRAITFKTVSGAAGLRSVVFTVSDGDGGTSAEQTKTVNVT